MKNYIFKLINLIRFIFHFIYLNITSYKKISPNHRLNKKITVSLTAKKERFYFLPIVLKSIVNQTINPNEIILWIEEENKKYLPKKILKLKKKIGLKIFYCKNYRSYNKIIHTINLRKKNYIITFDDDIIYHKKSIEYLTNKINDSNNNIIANRIHKIKMSRNRPVNYNNWYWNSENTKINKLNFQTGVYGVLYPPNSFHKDICKSRIFQKLSPSADDLWLYWMVRLNKKFIVWSEFKKRNIEVINFDDNSLRKINIFNKNNDNQIKNLIRYYGFPK